MGAKASRYTRAQQHCGLLDGMAFLSPCPVMEGYQCTRHFFNGSPSTINMGKTAWSIARALPWDGKDVSGRKSFPLSSKRNSGNCLPARHLGTSQYSCPCPTSLCSGPAVEKKLKSPPNTGDSRQQGSKVCVHPPFWCLFLSTGFPLPQGS